jgi:hypothetical protein
MPNGMGTGNTIYSFAIGGINIFAGAEDGVYISPNDASNWTHTSLAPISVLSLATIEGNTFAGTTGSGVYFSSNNGANWAQTALDSDYVYSLGASGNIVFAGAAGYGIYFSTNNGTSWIQSALNNQYVYSIAISGNNIFAGTSVNGVFISTNNGTNWTQTALTDKTIYALTISGNNIFAGTYGSGVYISTNNGTNWNQIGLNYLRVNALASISHYIFAGTNNLGIYISTNNGTNWTQINQGFTYITSIWSLLIKDNYVFAGNTGYSVWRRSLSEFIGIKKISENIPASFSLEQNYPNPFNPTTNIKFSIPVDSRIRGNDRVVLKVYDILGKEIETLVNENLSPGTYEVTFDASRYSSGVYFYKLMTDGYNETKRMILIK